MLKFIKQITGTLIAFFWMGLFASTAAAAVNVNDFRIGNQSDGVRVVFDMSQSVNYRVFLLDNPKRLVIDLDNTSINKVFTGTNNQLISKTRVGKLDGNNKRVVLELARPMIIKKAFMLQPQSGKPWRFVVDAKLATAQEFKDGISSKKIVTNDTKFVPQENKGSDSWFGFGSQDNNTSCKAAKRKRVIVLDPGHGGKDPGAIGAHGKTFEKNITLAMGKELQEILRRRGYTVYLTRNTDIFIPLRQRIKIAQKYKADLFMSLHADSAKNRSATGLSVYTLSDRASDAEAAALAERENKADIIGGVDLGNNTKEVNDILISLSQTDSRNKSSKYATYLVKEI